MSQNHPDYSISNGNLIEQLKKDHLYLVLGYDADSNGIIISDSIGILLTRQEFKELTQGLTKFFAFHSDKEIDEYNSAALGKQEDWMSNALSPSSAEQPPVGFVYLIHAENGLYKIGKTQNLWARFKPFSVSFPMKWEVVHSFRANNYSAAEAALHKMFADQRDVGEWFRLSLDDVAYIKALRDFSLDVEE